MKKHLVWNTIQIAAIMFINALYKTLSMKSMKYALMLTFLLAILVSSAVFAVVCDETKRTLITGMVYDEDTITGVAGTEVSVVCNQLTLTDTTDENGYYYVYYNNCDCPIGSNVVATATEFGTSEENTVIASGANINIGVAVIDVPVPEFSTIAAGIALVGAIAGFIFLRRKN